MAAPWTMVWFYNSITGSVISEPAFGDTIQSHLPGWHGPFGTKQEALNFYQQNAAANPDWKPPSGFPGVIGNAIKSGVQAGAGALTSGWRLAATGLSGWFMRGLKVLFGGVLMITGVSKLLNVDNRITQLAGKVPVL
jgi:hypothetical protein